MNFTERERKGSKTKFYVYCVCLQNVQRLIYLDIAAGEDALPLSNHSLQPVLIDCVEEVNDG